MNRWAEAWQASCSPFNAGVQDAPQTGPGSVSSVRSVTPPRVEGVAIDIANCRVSVEVTNGPGGIEAISVPVTTDPVRARAASIVNGWFAQGESLEAQSLRLLALSDMVAGLIKWRQEDCNFRGH